MTYIKVEWHHSNPNEPRILYSELDDRRWETRKVEEYQSGRRDFASKDKSSGSTFLGIEPVPPNSEINKDPAFTLHEITKSEFENIWSNVT
jgi:hypothetical protein